MVESNNAKCQTTIKSFKFKIWRRITYVLNDEIIETGEYMTGLKVPGCKPKETVRKDYIINLPSVEDDGKTIIPGTSC